MELKITYVHVMNNKCN